MVGDLLRDFEFAAVLQIRCNTGRTEGMIADPRFDAGRFRAPADDAVGVLLEEGIGCKLPSLAAGGAEEIAVGYNRADIDRDDGDRERRAPYRLFRVNAPNGGAPGQNNRRPSSE